MTDNNPLVSIIVRTKDRPKLLKQALRSIASQTYRPLEVVLVNDGGCDLAIDEPKGILGDVMLNYIRFKKNMGRPRAGNAGIEKAKGKYIGFLDDDDEFYPEHVEVLVSFLEAVDYKVAYTDSLMTYKEFNPRQTELIDARKEAVFSRDFDYNFLVFENYIPFMCLLFEREVLINSGGFDTSFELYEDWDLLIRIGEHFPFYHIKRVTAEYNQWGSDMQISQRNKDYIFIERLYTRVLSKHAAKITERRVRDYISQFVRTRNLLSESYKKSEYLENANREKDGRAKNLEDTLSDTNANIENLRLALAQKDARIAGFEAAVKEKDTRIAGLEAVVKEKGARIAGLETAVKEKDAHIAGLEAAVKEEDAHIETLEVSLKDKEEVLRHIYDSHGWKALLRYYRIRDKLLPPNSRRRLFIKLCVVAVKDPKGFIKSLNRQNIRKFFAQYKVLNPSVIESKVKMKTSLHAGNSRPSGSPVPDRPVFGGKGSVCAPDDEKILMPPKEKNRILVIDRSLPAYDKDSGALRMFSFLGILQGLGYRLTFLPDDLLNTEPYRGDLQRMGIEVLSGIIDIENYMKINGGVFSFVIISRPEQTYKYIALMRAYAIHSSLIYDTVDLHWVRFERTGNVTGDKDYLKKAEEYKAIELFNAASADITFTVTKEEKEILEKEIPGVRVEVMPNIHQISKGETPFALRKDIMFIGGFLHQPNEDAVLYFVSKILPEIKKKLNGIKFIVVGSDPSPAILGFNSSDIIVTGYVKDVSPYFNSCRVFVSPLRYGAGMKGKIGQSMSFGLPVVTTTIGAEGIGLIDGENALVADNPREFADAVVRIYTDEYLWNRISQKSVDHIETNYSGNALGKKIRDLFDSIRAVDAS